MEEKVKSFSRLCMPSKYPHEVINFVHALYECFRCDFCSIKFRKHFAIKIINCLLNLNEIL